MLAAGVLLMTMSQKVNAPRGIRNNNPGNIRWDNRTDWKGMIGVDDKNFVIFSHMIWGIRAMNRVLDSYARRGLVTIETIIPTWAPATENDTDSYVRSVVMQTGLNADRPIGTHERPALISAIIRHENGRDLTASLIAEGINAA